MARSFDLIALGVGLAIKLGLKAGDLRQMTAAYRSVGSDLGSLL